MVTAVGPVGCGFTGYVDVDSGGLRCVYYSHALRFPHGLILRYHGRSSVAVTRVCTFTFTALRFIATLRVPFGYWLCLFTTVRLTHDLPHLIRVYYRAGYRWLRCHVVRPVPSPNATVTLVVAIALLPSGLRTLPICPRYVGWMPLPGYPGCCCIYVYHYEHLVILV